MSWREAAKKRAAVEAVKNVEDGFVVGLGSGSTAALAIEEIGRRTKEESLRVLGIPTSSQAFFSATQHGILLTTLNEHPQIDLDIDGADQIDKDLNLIKGMGGALTREKIVAAAARKFIIVADDTKLTDKLGKGLLLPIEILPFAEPTISKSIEKMDGKPVLRNKKDGSGLYITDNGNFIIDADFGPIDDPHRLELELKAIPGIIETGLFINMTHVAYVGTEKAVKTIRKRC